MSKNIQCSVENYFQCHLQQESILTIMCIPWLSTEFIARSCNSNSLLLLYLFLAHHVEHLFYLSQVIGIWIIEYPLQEFSDLFSSYSQLHSLAVNALYSLKGSSRNTFLSRGPPHVKFSKFLNFKIELAKISKCEIAQKIMFSVI